MENIFTLIVDDERLARLRLRHLLSNETGFEIVGECANGRETLAFLENNDVDLIFLDVQMPEMDGFAVLDALGPDVMPATVFVTAYDEYAVKAFEVRALDYLLKPFDQARFRKTIERVREHLEGKERPSLRDELRTLLEDMKTQRSAGDRFAVRTGGRVRFVRAVEIDWIEAADNYVCLHAGEQTHLLRETMNAIETKLDPSRFLRIHRSAIVNVDRVKELQPLFRGDYTLILDTGAELTLSRNYRDKLFKVLGKPV